MQSRMKEQDTKVALCREVVEGFTQVVHRNEQKIRDDYQKAYKEANALVIEQNVKIFEMD